MKKTQKITEQVFKVVAIFNKYDHCGYVAENVTLAESLAGFAAKYPFDGAADQIYRIVTLS